MAGGRYAESDFADAGTPRLRNPLVRHVAGKVAIQRGPLVYAWNRPTTASLCITCGCLPMPIYDL